MIRTALFAAAAALATVATSAPVLAKDVAVTYKDLDLTSAQGKAELADRLDKAARDACDYGEMRTGTRIASRDASACYKQAQQQSKQAMAAILDQARLGG